MCLIMSLWLQLDYYLHCNSRGIVETGWGSPLFASRSSGGGGGVAGRAGSASTARGPT